MKNVQKDPRTVWQYFLTAFTNKAYWLPVRVSLAF
jgi:hypothetical protein